MYILVQLSLPVGRREILLIPEKKEDSQFFLEWGTSLHLANSLTPSVCLIFYKSVTHNECIYIRMYRNIYYNEVIKKTGTKNYNGL